MRVSHSRGNALFACCVSDIVCLCTKKQVFRIDTAGIVSPRAIMTNVDTWEQIPMQEYPGKAMGQHDSLASDESKFSITMRVTIGCPEPTAMRARCFVNLSPEPFFTRAIAWHRAPSHLG